MSHRSMHDPYTYPILVAVILLSAGCQKDISITAFADDYSAYKAELRIEAILNAVEPMQSIVRVDRTILVTDTSLFNGRDDDGDWDPLTDDTGEDGVFASEGTFGSEKDDGEGNGVPDPGEPHVDEYDEIISQLHDSTLTIQMYDVATGELRIDFAYEAQADSFEYFYATSNIAFGGDDLITELVYYGGYRPTAVYGTIEYYQKYEFRMATTEGLITGVTTPLPPAAYQVAEHAMVVDTLIVDRASRFQWLTDPDATVTWVTVQRIFGPDSVVTVTSHPAGALGQTDDGDWIGNEIIGIFFPGLYRWTVAVPSRAYGAYIYSELPMRDEQLSNLRDENDRVVLGVAGSTSPAVQYVRIPE